MAGVSFTDMDRKVNTWLGSIAGLPINTTSATFLRCELGVLPSQLVAERNALYFLWHLRNQTWFKDQLPTLTHLSPLSRLTELLTDTNTTLEEFHKCNDADKWHDRVKQAVLQRACSWYNTATHSQRLSNFGFVYRGQQYLRDDDLGELATTALHARADRLPGVPSAWEYHQCPFCQGERGMNGAHLLQCESLPAPLTASRDQVRSSLSVRGFAVQVLNCEPCQLVKEGLHFAQKLFKHTRKAVQVVPPPSQQSDTAGEDLET